jgi:2-oxoglutarate dehydrogenase E1 component
VSQPDFLNPSNLEYLESMYLRYQKDPQSVEPSLRYFFSGFDAARTEISIDPRSGEVKKEVLPTEFLQDFEYRSANIQGKNLEDQQERVFELISAYRKYGHLSAGINPIQDPDSNQFLQLSEHGLPESALSQVFYSGNLPGPDRSTLQEIIDRLEPIYCGTMAVEYVGIVQDADEFHWLQQHTEEPQKEISAEEKIWIYENLHAAAGFEQFLHRKFVGQKRFSLEGLDALNPLLHSLVDELGETGAKEIMLGMAHRGRLNVLTNLLGKPVEMIFSEFRGEMNQVRGDGDVKYHLGYYNDLVTFRGHKVSVLLNPNPSHLELVNPIIIGKVYHRQKVLEDDHKEQVIPVLIHGDAAFAGQGINMEVLQLSMLRGYSVGGTVHIVADNQIGFTAWPHESRSTRYATDLFRMINVPVFHVNADDPEASIRAVRLAVQYRQKFKKDVAINLVGYRRYGHNEGDEPAFTQPLMYERIRSHPSSHEMYRSQLLTEGKVDPSSIDTLEREFNEELEKKYELVTAGKIACTSETVEPGWHKVWAEDHEKRKTGVPEELLTRVIQGISKIPEEFNAHPKIRKFISQRSENWQNDRIDWSLAESLCFGTLLLEEYRVRLSGQDSRRGTFSQRNMVAFDQKTGDEYIPLNHIQRGQRQICVFNSMLSEIAVLGFEYGFALASPETLVMWEAQFGDFANGAQSLFDVFIVSGESKWQSKNGLVLLLPHGYEGQGPEHSSARIERYLGLCSDYNLRVCNTTTPANYFHVLRRQVLKKDRKPLILMTPKSLLRLRTCNSVRSDFFSDKVFLKVIVGSDSGSLSTQKVRRALLCSGRVYYDLLAYRDENKIDDIELVRLEQIYPFPFKTLRNVLGSYPNLEEVYFVQEERQNMGAWHFLQPRLQAVLQELQKEPVYIGRGEGSSPCTGSPVIHKEEQKDLVTRAFGPSSG